MAFNNVISRSDASALIPEDVSDVLLKEIGGTNPVLDLAQKLPNMPRSRTRMPVMSLLPVAYFVNGDTGLKQTTSSAWEDKYIDAEELAVIVPIPEAVLSDAAYDIWGQVRPELVKAFNKTIVQAILYGTNIPASWTINLGSAGITAGATSAGHVASIAAFPDLYAAILGESADGAGDGQLMLTEADGFAVNGHVADVSMKGRLRNCRDANGNPIFNRSMQDRNRYEIDGEPVYFPDDGSIIPANGLSIAGAWKQLMWCFRQDITYKILDQAVIQDAAGNIIHNLAQQDMVALRAVMRLGVALPNPINRMNEDDSTRYPFSILTA